MWNWHCMLKSLLIPALETWPNFSAVWWGVLNDWLNLPYSIWLLDGVELGNSHAHWLFPSVKEACSTAALLKTPRHRKPTSTVLIHVDHCVQCCEHSEIPTLFPSCFSVFRDFSRMHPQRAKIPTILCIHVLHTCSLKHCFIQVKLFERYQKCDVLLL